MESNDKGRQVEHANVTVTKQQDITKHGRNKSKQQGTLMVLTSGKVVGNVGAQ